MKYKLVRVLRLNSQRCEDVWRKVAQVHRDDDGRMAANCGSEHMPVVRIGKLQAGNQILVAGYECVDGVLVHELARTFQLLSCEAGSF